MLALRAIVPPLVQCYRVFVVKLAVPILLFCWTLSPAAPSTSPTRARAPSEPSPVTRVGRIADPAIPESSGLIASRKHPGVFWTHNDSGNPPFIFAIDREGRTLARVPIDAANTDWEDIAMDEAGRIYLADIGNNNATRKTVTVYRIEEPDPKTVAAVARPVPVPIEQRWTLAYPDQPFDSEAFFVHKGHGYMISKLLTAQRAVMYRFPLDAPASRPAMPATGRVDMPITLERVAELPIRMPVTAADISSDGRRLAVMTVAGLNVFTIDGDPSRAGRIEPRTIRFIDPHIEACCFVADGVLATNETRDVLLFADPLILPPATNPAARPAR